MADYYVREEDGTSHYLLEDASGALIEEGAEVDPSFIASVTTVYAPTFVYTGQQNTVTGAGTFQWLCPAGITLIYVECIAGGASGYSDTGNGTGKGGGGGGAYAARVAVPVTPGTLYTFVVGAGGVVANPGGTAGGDSSFTGDSGVQVIAKGGVQGAGDSGGLGGQASGSTGDTGLVFSGGGGGGGPGGLGSNAGAGGGASGNRLAAGNAGGNTVASNVAGAGGAGANGGGSGGLGQQGGVQGFPGTVPGGGGGGGGGDGGFLQAGAGSSGSVTITAFALSFIASVTAVYPPAIVGDEAVPFIGSATAVYAPTLAHVSDEVDVPFIASQTRVFGIFSLYDPARTFSGPGNGGEVFLIRLNENGVTSTATLAANISDSDTALTLTGDGGFPSTVPFVVTIDSEVLYVIQVAAGSYRVRGRAASNTAAAAHTAGATVSWGDSYDQALTAEANIAHDFTADIESTGSFTYPGWLVSFDSSQAYLAGDRYPMHVTMLVGVFDAGAGSTGTNRLDASQPNAICTPTGVSDDCPAALSNPARISSNIDAGDVALVRYTNPEAVALDLGPRSVSLQSWFGLKRVDDTDADVTFTDPSPPDSGGHGAHVVDTIPGTGPYTGSVNDEWLNPSSTGIGPSTGTPTPNPVPYTTVTLPGSDRYFTDGIHYNEKGWPFGVLAVRQGNRRVPHWQSYDWHNFSFVYDGFGIDCTFAQIVVNRNGVAGNEPEVVLPGSQDITGPDAVWDDGTYYFAVSWYVAIFAGPYLVIGPVIGGTGPGGTSGGDPSSYVPGVSFPPVGSPVITPPSAPTIEGGSGGDITPGQLTSALFQAASV